MKMSNRFSLTDTDDNPNGGEIRFMVEGAVPPSLEGYTRGIYIFDGHDEAALPRRESAGGRKSLSGHAVTYWQQKPSGGWEKKA